MSPEPSKNQTVFSWIASIAASVLCCSILFVLFASYIVDIKGSIEETSNRMTLIQEREDRILTELDMVHKHIIKTNQGQPGADGHPADAAVPGAPAGATADKVPEPAPADAAVPPAAPAPVATPPAASQGAPSISSPAVAPPAGAPMALVPVTPPAMPVPPASAAIDKK